ncbi:transaldolase [Alcaligenaceae bacterium CGII-47]|nr:transaldolase [Alcaligenaceae bacterium CGII-47]
MNATRELQQAGQSLWLDNITRGILNDGTLARYIQDLAVSGLTSNPTIFHKAIDQSDLYDEAIALKAEAGQSGEDLFFNLAIEDLQRAADLFRPVHEATQGVDGWVSLEVSPLLAADAPATIKAAVALHRLAARANLYIKIPGTQAGLAAIEESIFRGVPINVTLLFSTDQYVDAASAYMRGIERRLNADLDPVVSSVASLFVSRWDVAANDQVSADLQNCLGIAMAKTAYEAYLELQASPRWRILADAGARHQRLLWASTGTKDPKASDTLYIQALAAPDTINTIPENTLLAFADHGHVAGVLSEDSGDAAQILAKFQQAGVNLDKLADQLLIEGTQSFEKSWKALLASISSKSKDLNKVKRSGTAK